jgi:hypothetical protein
MLSRVSIRKPPRRSIMRAITRWRGPAKVPYEERECMEARHGRSDAASGKVPSCLGTHVLRYIGMRFRTYVPDYAFLSAIRSSHWAVSTSLGSLGAPPSATAAGILSR